ncbi:50S ribosomal protein L18 [bacterium]|nr:50S ribosomal protein L18 [bacterium]
MKRDKIVLRLKRKKSIRKKVNGTTERPRLTVFKSSGHIYAQVINDELGVTLVTASTLSKSLKENLNGKTKTEKAVAVGALVAELALQNGITSVVYDRNGYPYHGRVKALADAAREKGLNF